MSPAKAAHRIMWMGLICTYWVPTKVATKSETLTQKVQGSVCMLPKFSLLQSSKVAAANKPTTTGRRPAKILCITTVCMYFMNMRLMRIIRMNEGNTSAKVAMHEPAMAKVLPKPAL